MLSLFHQPDSKNKTIHRCLVFEVAELKNAIGLLLLVVLLAPSTGCISFRRNVESQLEIHSRELTNGGIHAQQRGNETRVEQLFSKAIQANPEDKRAHQFFAKSLAARGETNRAIRHLERAVELSRGEPEVVVELGRLIAKTGNWQLAEAYADDAIRSDRKNISGWLLKGEACEMQAKPRKALTNYLNALSLNEENNDARFAVARIYNQIGKPQRALSNLALISKSYPESKKPEELVLLESESLIAMNCISEAANRMDQIMQRDHPSPRAFLVYSQVLEKLGESNHSRIVMQRAANLYPQNSEIIQNLRSANNSARPVQVANFEGS